MRRSSLLNRFARFFGSKNKDKANELWQDREIRFDLASSQLKPRNGESIFASLENVEDSKGRRLEIGSLYTTNLRTIWSSTKRSRRNISIGHRCVVDIKFEASPTRLRGNVLSVRLLTRFANSSFHFVFSSVEGDTSDVFRILGVTVQSYAKTRLFRDLTIRDLLMHETMLILLDGEELMEQIAIVYNLVVKETNLGTLFVTNFRVVWNSTETLDLNISIPYLQVIQICLRDSKFGRVLVIETSEKSGGYVLGFRIEPESELDTIRDVIQSIKNASDENPIFGVIIDSNPSPVSENIPTFEPNGEEQEDLKGDAFAMYCTFDEHQHGQPPVFDPILGLAIEALKEGITIEDLWNVV